MAHWHRSLWNRFDRATQEKHRPEYVPEEIHLVHYPEQTSMQEELVRARDVVEKAGA